VSAIGGLAGPAKTSRAADSLLWGGLGALVCGLTMVVVSLGLDPGASLIPASSATPRTFYHEAHHSAQLVRLCACEPEIQIPAAHEETPLSLVDSRPSQVPRSARPHLDGEGLGLSGKTSGDRRNELLRTAALRWIRATPSAERTTARIVDKEARVWSAWAPAR
jgi:hypothetical protein